MVTGIKIRWFVILLDLGWSASGEFFSSISHMKRLIETQEDIINSLEDYYALENRRMSGLDKKLRRYQFEYQNAIKNVTNYITNPINAYTLIKGLTSELDSIEEKIYQRSEYKKSRKVDYPTEVDLDGAALAISRLQTTYRLNVSEMASGLLAGEPSSSTPMSACDCYEIGKVLYKEKQFAKGIVWMSEALDRYKPNESQLSHVSLFNVIENICFGFLKLGDKKSVMIWNNWLIALKRKDSELKELTPTIKQYQELLAKEEAKKQAVIKLNLNKPEKKKDEEIMYIYETLCRNEVVLADEVTKSLKCSYLTGPDPFLRLAPIKMEHLYLDPDVILFHGVVSDSEITYIIDKAEPKIRVSKGTSFHDESSDVMARITHRVRDMIGMSVEFTEWQTINYGIGGQYLPHHDNSKTQKLSNGSRQATVLFYISNVAQGGATVFPGLGLTVFPQKGAALYWNNLHPSGEIDLSSLHASCPVLRGSKWILIVWTLYMSIGHEFLKPCTMEYQSADYVRNLPPPKLITRR